jgi:cytoskeleton protein RodZ
MMPIGEVLRSERIRRNLQLEQISRELKIPKRLLAAIEGDKFDQLPAGVFARNFVRQYAQLLGLDGDEMAERAAAMFRPEPQSEFPEKDKPTVPEIRLPRMDEWEAVGEKRFAWGSSLPALALVVVVMLLCSGVYAWWQRSRRIVSSSQAATPVVRAVQKAAPAPPPATPAIPSPAGTLAQPGVPPAQPPSAPPAEPAASAASADRPTDPVKPRQVEEIDPKAPVRVQLVAQGEVWVRAQVDGKYKFSAMLQPNESRAVNGAGEVVVRVGNAGLLDIVLNGQSIGKLGPLGQVRTVQLTPGGFKIVAPEPKPASPPPPPSEPL